VGSRLGGQEAYPSKDKHQECAAGSHCIHHSTSASTLMNSVPLSERVFIFDSCAFHRWSFSLVE
jgi:hypothetical protein